MLNQDDFVVHLLIETKGILFTTCNVFKYSEYEVHYISKIQFYAVC